MARNKDRPKGREWSKFGMKGKKRDAPLNYTPNRKSPHAHIRKVPEKKWLVKSTKAGQVIHSSNKESGAWKWRNSFGNEFMRVVKNPYYK